MPERLLEIDRLAGVRYRRMGLLRALLTGVRDRVLDAVLDVSLTLHASPDLRSRGWEKAGRARPRWGARSSDCPTPIPARFAFGDASSPGWRGALDLRDCLAAPSWGRTSGAPARDRNDVPGPGGEPEPAPHGAFPRYRALPHATTSRSPTGDWKTRAAGAAAVVAGLVGLAPRVLRMRYPHELSGGQARRDRWRHGRVAGRSRSIARLIIADEPTAGSSRAPTDSVQGEILNLMAELQRAARPDPSPTLRSSPTTCRW